VGISEGAPVAPWCSVVSLREMPGLAGRGPGGVLLLRSCKRGGFVV